MLLPFLIKVLLTFQVERHLRKLDQEVSKFKMELEADHAGITETLEKRSLELDIASSTNHKHESLMNSL